MNATALLSRFRRTRGAVVPHRKDTAELETIDIALTQHGVKAQVEPCRRVTQ